MAGSLAAILAFDDGGRRGYSRNSYYGRNGHMFIAHGERVRKYMPWILAGVLVLMLPGFLVMFGPSGSVKQQRSQLPTIGGKPVNLAEFQTARNAVMTDIILNSGRRPPGTLQVEDEINIRAVQRLILLRKARELGIRVTDEEVVREIRALPPPAQRAEAIRSRPLSALHDLPQQSRRQRSAVRGNHARRNHCCHNCAR